jgi:hypothetical protein
VVGAAFLAAAGGSGRFFFEVEVLEAGKLYVGFAGTNLGLQCRNVGDDACSWGCEDDGWVRHRSRIGLLTRLIGITRIVVTQIYLD